MKCGTRVAVEQTGHNQSRQKQEQSAKSALFLFDYNELETQSQIYGAKLPLTSMTRWVDVSA